MRKNSSGPFLENEFDVFDILKSTEPVDASMVVENARFLVSNI